MRIAIVTVFVHTGPYETFRQTVQEAMASGLPVIAPAAGGPLDLVIPGRTGYLVEPGSAGAFTDAIRRLGADPARRAQFGSEARASALGRTWEAIGDELIGHYAAVCGARAGVAA